MLDARLVEHAARPLRLPPIQQVGGGRAAIEERERGRHRWPRHALVHEGQLIEPEDRAVGHLDASIRPVGLVAGDAVTAIGHLEGEGRRAAEVARDLDRGRALPHEGRLPERLIGHDSECHRAPAAEGVAVAVDTHRGEEASRRPGEPHDDPAVCMGEDAPVVALAAEGQGSVVAAHQLHRIVVALHAQAGGLGATHDAIAEERRRPLLGGVDLAARELSSHRRSHRHKETQSR